MMIYLLKTTLSLILLFGVYKLFLENLKMHQFKRFYLLLALICSLCFPLLKFSETALPWDANFTNTNLQPILIGSQSALVTTTDHITGFVGLIYGLGVLLLSCKFILNLFKFQTLQKGQITQVKDGIEYVFTSKTSHTFAFWNRIYLPKERFDNVDFSDEIILHETAHIKQFHSADIIFIEILKIIFWFNPIFYLYKKAISLNHEFLADESVIKTTQNTVAYLQILMQQQTKMHAQTLGSSFYYQPTKKRFMMTTKTINKRKNILAQGLSSLLLTAIAVFSVQAQTINHSAPSTTEKPSMNEFQTVEKIATYPGGMSEFNKYFISKFRTQETFDGGVAKLIFQFMVEEDGKIDEVKILRGLDEKTDLHIIDILKNSIPWIPAENGGKKVRSLFTIPVTIKIQEEVDDSSITK